jgi:hypothetical protein
MDPNQSDELYPIAVLIDELKVRAKVRALYSGLIQWTAA